MKNKPHDTPYCGVSTQKISDFPKENINADSLNMLLYYVSERYKIHLRKDIRHIHPPYTKDPVLKQFRFTNIRREHDKETKWLIQHITNNQDLTYEDKLLNCILFRLFNKHETSELINEPIQFSKGYDPELYRPAFEQRYEDDPEYVFWTGAFYTGGFKRAAKCYMPEGVKDTMEMRAMYFMKYLLDQDITQQLTADTIESPQDICNLLQSYMGIGEFLAYQMFVDMTYIDEFPFSENEFTIAGPGAKLGLRFLFGDRGKMTYEELIFWLRDNWHELNQYNIQNGHKHTAEPIFLFTDLPEDDRVMNVMSLENCMCEFSKFYKTKHELGRPRKIYKGGNYV